ncbi:MAG: hydroxymethylbilane synthase [Gammaproteobacteria bacterium TMED1]|jgi:hydroxymethylbilane synthase|nr:MAG: hydroxymethylbilane synthase [Gammaproteobacteria bacterium TMED1]|tara:strand:- start:2845 stop:3753 length:909 start_codon:yes stop_codon:yes gene_type:complete
MDQTLRIATRKSALALWQANYVRDALIKCHPKLDIEILGFTTEGDRNQRDPLSKIGGKGLFLKELEAALVLGEADIAVHSMKDVPSLLPFGLEIGAICKRDDASDALISRTHRSLQQLKEGSKIGTSSLRRRQQLLAMFPRFEYLDLRGNVDTRLHKLNSGEYDAIVLAVSGLYRLGLSERITERISTDLCLPAAGQGAIGIECRSDDSRIRELIAPINDERSAICVMCERQVAVLLGADCSLPIAVFATMSDKEIHISSFVGDEHSSLRIRKSITGLAHNSIQLAEELAQSLIDDGATSIS